MVCRTEMKHKLSVVLMGTVVLLMGACSSSKEAAVPEGATEKPLTALEQMAKDKALEHFVEGSLNEMKGDHAKAILEYQDALRYDQNHAIYFALSKSYSALNKHSLATEAGKEAVRLSPDNMEYRRTLADTYVAAFEVDKAVAEYEEIVKRDSNSINSWYSLARLVQGKNPKRALEVYTHILDRFGPEWDVLIQIAELHNAMGQPEKSADALKQMLEIDPGNIELKQSVAEAYIRAEKYDTALAILQELRSLNPDNMEYSGGIATIHLQRKDYARAAEEFQAILKEDSVTLDSKMRIGELYFQQMEKDSTLAPITRSIFEDIRDKHPEDWRPYWFLGAIGAVTGNDTLTEPNFRKVTELASWNADGWVYLTSVLMERNDFEEVVTVLEEAQKVLPDEFRVHFFLGVAYNRLQRNQEAARAIERARIINPKDVNAIIQLAIVYDALQNQEETDKLYEEALKLDPDNHLALNNYGYSLAERNIQIERALEMSKKAVEAQPENASYLDTIGWVYFRLGKYKEAEEYIKKAIDKGNPSSVLFEHLGDVYFMMNERDRALEQWNIALKMDEGNTILREKVARGTL